MGWKVSLHIFKEFKESQTRHTTLLTDIIVRWKKNGYKAPRERQGALTEQGTTARGQRLLRLRGNGVSDDFGLLREE